MTNFARYVVTHYGQYIKRIEVDRKGNRNTYRLGEDIFASIIYHPDSRKYIFCISDFTNVNPVRDITIKGLTRKGCYNALVCIGELLDDEWVANAKEKFTTVEQYLNTVSLSPEYIKEKNKYKKGEK